MRVPVTGYSLSLGKAHTDFAEAKLQQRLVARKLSDQEIDQLAVVAMAGATAEAMHYDEASSQLLCHATYLYVEASLMKALESSTPSVLVYCAPYHKYAGCEVPCMQWHRTVTRPWLQCICHPVTLQ